jgi:hypothetical protein
MAEQHLAAAGHHSDENGDEPLKKMVRLRL